MSDGAFARVADSFLDEGIKGQWFANGRGPLSVPNASSGRFLLVNPVGSGKLVLIHRYRTHINTNGEFVSIHVNPTTNLPVTAASSSNRRIGAAAGVAVVTQDVGVSAMSGGTMLGYQIPVSAGIGASYTEFQILPSIVVPPGFSIGTNFANTSGGAANWSVLLDWKEVPE